MDDLLINVPLGVFLIVFLCNSIRNINSGGEDNE